MASPRAESVVVTLRALKPGGRAEWLVRELRAVAPGAQFDLVAPGMWRARFTEPQSEEDARRLIEDQLDRRGVAPDWHQYLDILTTTDG